MRYMFGFNDINNQFGDELEGRYESVFINDNNYTKAPDEVKKFFNDKYLNFLRYYSSLPKITIIKNSELINDIIYPENKIEIVNDINDSDNHFIIYSSDIKNKYDLIIEYFKYSRILYCNTNLVINSEQNLYSKILTIEN